MALHYICEWCGKSGIDHKKKTRRFCSMECKRAYQASRYETRNCAYCGKEFTVSLDSAYQRQRHVCSRSCWNRLHHPPSPDKKTVYTCKGCGKEFVEWTYRNKRFCSHQCMSEYAARQPKLKSRKPEIHVIRTCVICGKPYHTTTHQIKNRGSSCCSRECMGEYTSIRQRGEKHHNWRGGSVHGRGGNWEGQRRKALKRDGCRCQICGKKVSRFKHDYGIHHIKPYREFNGDYMTANQLLNLITLCRSCHAKVEFGKIPCPQHLL